MSIPNGAGNHDSTGRLVFVYEFDHLDGGVSHSILEMIRALKDRRKIVAIVPDDPDVRAAFESLGVDVRSIPRALWQVSFSKPIYSALNCVRIQNSIRSVLGEQDIIIVNGILPEFVCGLFGRLKNWRRIYFVRGAVGQSKLWGLMSFSGLVSVVCVSEFAKQQFLGRFPKLKVESRVISNYIEFPRVIEIRGDSVPLYIGCVGFFHPDKNQLMLVRALKIVREKGIDARVKFYGKAGSEVDRLYLDKLTSAIEGCGLGSYVSFEGYRPRECIYKSINVLVSTSLSEGFGKTILEGMAYGVPVIAFAGAGGPRDIIRHRHDGLLLERYDDELLAGAIVELYENIEFSRKLSFQARERVLSDFSKERFLEKISEIL